MVRKGNKYLHGFKKKKNVICLQETHYVQADETLWRKEWGGPIVFSHGLKNSRGVMSYEGRYVILKFIIGDKQVCLINVYTVDQTLIVQVFLKILMKLSVDLTDLTYK